MNIAIIYHDADFDGKLSNEVCRFYLSKIHPNASIHSYGWDYGRPVPSVERHLDPLLGDQSKDLWCDYDQIYIVDLSVDELMSRPELRDKIIWIDHHKSAIEKWKEVQFTGYCIDGVAACRLCWQWFTWNAIDPATQLATKQDFIDRKVYEPELIRLAGEYDIWDHRDPDAKALQFGLRAIENERLQALIEEEFNCRNSLLLKNTIKSGHAIKLYCDKNNSDYAKWSAHTIKWEGLTFCALNIGQRGNSDLLLGGIKPEHDACFAWRWTGKDVLVSLYHIDGKTHHDLSLIAVKYGGGGHRGACGFRTNFMELSKILTSN